MNLDEAYGLAPSKAPTAKLSTSGRLTLDDVYGSPAASTPHPTTAPSPVAPPLPAPPNRAVRGAKSFVAGAADLVDLGLVGLPAMAVGVSADIANRVIGLFDSRTRAGVLADSEMITRTISEAAGTPLRNLLTNLGAIDKTDETAIGQVMDKISSALDSAGASIEEKTGGKIAKQDFLSVVNSAFVGLGGRGLAKGVEIYGKRADAKANAEMQSKFLANANAEAEARTLAAAEQGDALPTLAMQQAAEAAALRPSGVIRRHPDQVPRAPQQQTSSEVAALRAQVAALERQQVRGAGASGVEAPELAEARSRLAQAELADFRREPRTPVTDPAARRAAGTPALQMGPQRPFNATLDSGMRKTAEGRAFDLTPEERIAVRGMRQKMDARTTTAAVVGATGLGLAMAYGADAEEAAMAIGGGALILGKGPGLKLADIAALPDATPLSALRDRLAVTTSTLEKLDGARFDFSKQQVTELLKRQEVTAFERDLMTKALETVPGERVTAKQLVAGLKVASQDFELAAKQTDEFASYGLSGIGRTERDMIGREAWIPEDATPEEAARLTAEAEAKYNAAPVPTTTIWQSPIKLGTNNHFGDPNYFAHTRSFEEGGVKHVVEIQSDLAQKTGKVLTPEERSSFQTELAALKEEKASLEAVHAVTAKKVIEARRAGLPQDEVRALDMEMRRSNDRLNAIDVKQAELQAKLSASSFIESVAPMLKNWHKRLIREEIASAARAQVETQNLARQLIESGTDVERGQALLARPPAVRFATADTVAKVEGWPSRQQALLDRLENERTIARLGTGSDRAQALQEIANLERRLAAEPTRFSPEHQGIYDRYSKDIEKFLRQIGGKPYTDSTGNTWLEVPVGLEQKTLPAGGARTQLGGSDPAMLKTLAAVGGSAALAAFLTDDEEKKGRNALAAGVGAAALSLLMLKKSSSPAVARKAEAYLRNVEDWAGNTSYQIEKASPPVLRAMDRYKKEQLVLRHDLLGAATPFAESLRRMAPRAAEGLPAALLTGDWRKAIAYFGKLGVPEAVTQLGNVRRLLERVGRDLKDSGAIRGTVDNYFPRLVTDLEGLRNFLGKPTADFVTQALQEAERKMGRPLDSVEASQAINRALENSIMKGDGDGSTFRAGRTLDQIREGMVQFYAPPSESLLMYLDWASNAIARAKFFGKHGVIDPKTGMPDLDGSIGNVLADEFKKGKMTEEQRVELARLMRGEFKYADQASPELLQTLQNLSNASLIGQVSSAFMNLGDVSSSVLLHGVLPTIKAIGQTLGKSDGRVKPADLGLIETISAELTHGTRAPVIVNVPGYGGVTLSSAKFLDTVLKYSGFRALDSFGKQVLSNAAREKARLQVATPTGLAKFTKDHAAYFGEDLPQLVADLKGPTHTPLTLEYLWRQVSNAQPLTSLDMPTARTANPTFRFAWQLQSYMIKQLTLMRKEGIDKIRAGEIAEGTKFLARYALIVGGGQATTAWIVNNLLFGQDDPASWGDIPMNALKNFGISQYAIDQYNERGLAAAAVTFTNSPILSLLNLFSGDEKAVASIPIAGRVIYQQALGGNEKANEKAEKRRIREEREGAN